MPRIMCDDGTMKADDPLKVYTDLCTQGMETFGGKTRGPSEMQLVLEKAGFKDVRCVVKKVPISTWPRDRKLRVVGLFMKSIMVDLLGAMAAKPLAALNMPVQERQRLATAAKESLQGDPSHRYVEFCICYGRKDSSASEEDGSHT
jgi:hypothetical protein